MKVCDLCIGHAPCAWACNIISQELEQLQFLAPLWMFVSNVFLWCCIPSGLFLPHLTHLDISSNQLSAALPDTWPFEGPRTLQHLNMSHNHLTGPVPASWLDIMPFDVHSNSSVDKAVIDLSHNQLVGWDTVLGWQCVHCS